MKTAIVDVATAGQKFATAEAAVAAKRAAHRAAEQAALSAEGLQLADALATREAARRELDAAESALTEAGSEFRRATEAQAAANAAHRRERVPGVRAETKKIAREIDGHFTALEKLFDLQAEPLAREIERDLCVSVGGHLLNSPELGRAPYLGVLRFGGRQEELRDLISLWRDAATQVR